MLIDTFAACVIEVGPETPTSRATRLLLHFDDLTDSSKTGKAIINNGVTIVEKSGAFGGKCAYFNGSSRLTLPDYADLHFGSGDWTIDWREYKTLAKGSVFNLNSTSGGLGVLAEHMDGTQLYISSGSAWELVSAAPAFPLALNQWVHRALVRNGSRLVSYQNGTKVWESMISGDPVSSNLVGSFIGSHGDPGNPDYFTGYLDEFRVSIGAARWTAGFVPPTGPYPVND